MNNQPPVRELKLETSPKRVMLFGQNLQNAADISALLVANLGLCGEEKEVEQALALVNKDSSLLQRHVKTVYRGQPIAGTPLQIIAMAGDFDLRTGIKEEKHRGLFERLALAGGLSEKEIVEQLKVITSDEAKKANETRNLRVLNAIIKFGESILKVKANKEEFQILCQPIIEELEKDLTPNPEEVITSGFIFDPQILSSAVKWWLQDNIDRFGGSLKSLHSDAFCIYGLGKLQSKLCSRDAQATRASIDSVVRFGEIPARTLTNSDGSCYFSQASGLGSDFFIPYASVFFCLHGIADPARAYGAVLAPPLINIEKFCNLKTEVLQNLCNIQTTQNISKCK